MGYINSTPVNIVINQGINNNGKNVTFVDNRRTLPGSRVYLGKQDGLVARQGPSGHHQATDHNGREEDSAEMGPTEARKR